MSTIAQIRAGKISSLRKLIALALVISGLGLDLGAAELGSETLKRWNSYVETVQAGMDRRKASDSFLWIDGNPDSLTAVRKGGVEVAPADENGQTPVPGGLIHHWIGAVFIPDTSLDLVESVTRDYSSYKYFFSPEMIDSRMIRQSGDFDDYYLRWATKVLFVSAGINAECRSHKIRVDDRRVYQVSTTTKVQEIRNFGRSEEQQLPPDQGDGFVWRLLTITRFEARNGGVYLEIDASALTRDIPGSLRFLVGPIVKKISRNSLALSLKQTRDAVMKVSETVAATHSRERVANGQASEANQVALTEQAKTSKTAFLPSR